MTLGLGQVSGGQHQFATDSLTAVGGLYRHLLDVESVIEFVESYEADYTIGSLSHQNVTSVMSA